MKKHSSCHAQYRKKYWYRYVQICFRGIDRAPTKPSKVSKSKQYYSALLTVVDNFFGCVAYYLFVFVLVRPFAGSAGTSRYPHRCRLAKIPWGYQCKNRTPEAYFTEGGASANYLAIATMQLSYARPQLCFLKHILICIYLWERRRAENMKKRHYFPRNMEKIMVPT